MDTEGGRTFAKVIVVGDIMIECFDHQLIENQIESAVDRKPTGIQRRIQGLIGMSSIDALLIVETFEG